MIKKNDLAKQFELVVQQEIKNYQDSLNSILESIRDLNSSIITLKKEFDQRNAKSKSINQSMALEIERLKDSLSVKNAVFDSHINDQRKINERNIRNQEELYDEIEKKSKIDDSFDKKFRSALSNIESMKEEMNECCRYMNSHADDLLLRFTREITKTKKEILDTPSGLLEIQKNLEEKIAINKVDVDGIMREINFFKKEKLIHEKKIENLYTLIERLKNR